MDRLVDIAAGFSDQLRRPLGSSGRGVELAVVMELDDLALRHVLGHHAGRRASASTAPIAKFGASRQFAPFGRSLGSLLEDLRGIEPGGAGDNVGSACQRLPRMLPGPASGVVKSTTTSAPSSTSANGVSSAGSARPLSSMSSAASSGLADRLSHPPGRSGYGDLNHAATRASLTDPAAARKRSSSAPMQAAERWSGASELRAELVDVVNARRHRHGKESHRACRASGVSNRTERAIRAIRAAVASRVSTRRPFTCSFARASSSAEIGSLCKRAARHRLPHTPLQRCPRAYRRTWQPFPRRDAGRCRSRPE